MKKKRFDMRIVIPFCAAVVLLCVLAVAIVASLLGDAELAAEKYVQNLMEGNADALLAMYPAEALAYVSRETGLTEEDMKMNMRSKLSLWLQGEITDECGALLQYTYLSESESEVSDDLIEEMETNFDVRVSSAKEFTFTYRAKGAKAEKSGEITVGVAKIGGEWVLYDLRLLT